MAFLLDNGTISSNLLQSGNSLWNPPYHAIIQFVIWLVASALSLETILGNAMVLIAYQLERSISKQLNNRFIISLAISDLIIGIEGIPLFTVYVVNGDKWPLGAIACETWLFLDYTLCLVSILTVLLITADRYLSVCHTASYMKWQTPLKIQLLIFTSWLLPALIFGIMIYGWPWIGKTVEEIKATSNGECYAPFLSNPFVNMSMYLAYYWTTLVAMLILYKGVHKAARKLEKRSRAREHRHIALLLTQRLGTQVGVGLLLHAKKYHEEVMQQKQPTSSSPAPQTDIKDSGYTTNNTLSTNEATPDRQRSSFSILMKAVQSTKKLTDFRGRGATFTVRTNTNTDKIITCDTRSNKFCKLGVYACPHTLERLTEQNSTSQVDIANVNDLQQQPKKNCTSTHEQNQAEQKSFSISIDNEDDNVFPNKSLDLFDSEAIASLKTITFHEDLPDSLSSVLHFNPSSTGSKFLINSDRSLELIDVKGSIKQHYHSLKSQHTNTNMQSRSLIFRSLREKQSPPLRIKQFYEKENWKLGEANNKPDRILFCHNEILEQLPSKKSITLDVQPRLFPTADQKSLALPHETLLIRRRRRSTTSSCHDTRKGSRHQHCSRKLNEQTQIKHQILPQACAQRNRIFDRFSEQLEYWIRKQFRINNAESSSNCDPKLSMPICMQNSRSFSSISSMTSSTAPSKRTSILAPPPLNISQQQIPTLTITRDYSTQQSITQSRTVMTTTQTEVRSTTLNEQVGSPSQLYLRNESARRSSGFLQTLFAPISTFQRRRKRTKAERRAHKAFRTITFIVGLFAILWSPYYVVATIYGFCHGDCIPGFVYNISYYMCYLNSSLNPFAYALANRQFRRAFMKILKGNFHQSN